MIALSVRRTDWTGPLRAALVLVFILIDANVLLRWGSQLVWFQDARSYWGPDLANLYRGAADSLSGYGVFRYAPPIGQAMAPLGLFPWPAFVTLWTILGIGALFVLARGSWAVLGALVAFPPVLAELQMGNIHLLMALAVALSFRWPAAWAFLALTKVTPGIGMLWFAFRGEWRSFLLAAGGTALIIAVGCLLWPALWTDWFASLAASGSHARIGLFGPLALRLPVALVLLWLAARTDRRWLVPVAVLLAMPTVWFHSLAVLAAVPALRRGNT